LPGLRAGVVGLGLGGGAMGRPLVGGGGVLGGSLRGEGSEEGGLDRVAGDGGVGAVGV
jgi:hypothetical protein